MYVYDHHHIHTYIQTTTQPPTYLIPHHTTTTMLSTLALSTLLTSVLALPQYATPSPTPSPSPSPYFGVISARSASPIHLLPLQASGGKFYLGGTPSGYCPVEAVGQEVCDEYPGNTTTLAGGYGTLSLGVVVPGGQQGMWDFS